MKLLLFFGIFLFFIILMGCSSNSTQENNAYCIDSDQQNDFGIKGTVTIVATNEQHTDNCRYDLLTEYSCKKGSLQVTLYDCTKEGKSCQDGACISDCFESDGGKEFFVHGVTKGYVNNPPQKTELQDCCVQTMSGGTCENAGPVVSEKYCENGFWAGTEYFTCENGCYLGACRR